MERQQAQILVGQGEINLDSSHIYLNQIENPNFLNWVPPNSRKFGYQKMANDLINKMQLLMKVYTGH